MTLKEEFYETHLKRWVKKDFKDLTKQQLDLIDELPAFGMWAKKRLNFDDDMMDAIMEATNKK